MSARLVVTLPRACTGTDALDFARAAHRRGAQLIELRTDFHEVEDVDAPKLARRLPLIVAERGRPIPRTWLVAASEVDRPLGSPSRGATVISHHAARPLSPDQAVALWEKRGLGSAFIKHVEPLGRPSKGTRLLETQRRLVERFGAGRVTVLCTGPLALAFRTLLAARNVLEYVAFDDRSYAAKGQRLLSDAHRERVARPMEGRPRRGILGSDIASSRSPLVHRQPFDRLDLPADADVGSLLRVLHAYYDGFAVTSPFKMKVARLISAKDAAVNTLIRRAEGWVGANTDVEGAIAILRSLEARRVTVLGDGGATAGLRTACARSGVRLGVLRRRNIGGRALRGTLIWTWPSGVAAPESLRFARARVAVISYGAPARRIETEIRERGGIPVPLGRLWFDAQARAQQRLWNAAEAP
jgi:hypothetical protein